MHARAQGRVVAGEMNRPGKIAGASVATTVHQAADAAKGVSQRDARRKHVGYFPERQLSVADVQDAGEGRPDQAAVKDQSTSADVKNLPERSAGEILAPIGEDIEPARADDRAENQPGTEVDHRLAANPVKRRPPSSGPESGEQTERDENAVPVDSETAQVKGDLVHVAGNLEFAN